MRLKTVTSTLDRRKRWENGKLLSFSCSSSVRSTLVSTNPARFPSSVPKRVRIRGLDCCRFGSEFMNSGLARTRAWICLMMWYLIMWCWFEDLVCVWSGKILELRRTHECSWYFLIFSLCLIWKILERGKFCVCNNCCCFSDSLWPLQCNNDTIYSWQN